MVDAKRIQKQINVERKKRGLRHIEWNDEMSRLAYKQAQYCQKKGRLIHSDRDALAGGENLEFIPNQMARSKKAVKIWMHSPPHRARILDSRVMSAGVGIHKGRYHGKSGYYIAWAFCSWHRKGYYLDKTKRFLNGGKERILDAGDRFNDGFFSRGNGQISGGRGGR